MQTGITIIATALPGVKSIIRHNENGLLFEAGNVDALLEQIHYFLVAPEKYKELARQAYIDVEHYDWESINSRIVEYIKGVLND